MHNRKETKKAGVKSIIYTSFMKSPIPLCISSAKDGTFVEMNETACRYMGLKREDIIGHKSTKLGFITEKQRQLLVMDELKKNDLVKNIPLEIKINNQVIQALFGVHKFKHGKEDFLFCFIYSIPNHKQHIDSSESDLFYKLALLDLKYIKDRLKQYQLTSRQKEITALSASGKSNRDIAKELCISEHTVKDHLKEIFLIIGVHHRSELIPKLLNL